VRGFRWFFSSVAVFRHILGILGILGTFLRVPKFAGYVPSMRPNEGMSLQSPTAKTQRPQREFAMNKTKDELEQIMSRLVDGLSALCVLAVNPSLQTN